VPAEYRRTLLSAIPGIARLAVGVPIGTPRDTVDNSYGVALLIEFADVNAHDIYQSHPDHQHFVSECHPLWSRVQIYDSLAVEECGGPSPQFWGIGVRGKGLKRRAGASPALQNPEIRKNTEQICSSRNRHT